MNLTDVIYQYLLARADTRPGATIQEIADHLGEPVKRVRDLLKSAAAQENYRFTLRKEAMSSGVMRQRVYARRGWTPKPWAGGRKPNTSPVGAPEPVPPAAAPKPKAPTQPPAAVPKPKAPAPRQPRRPRRPRSRARTTPSPPRSPCCSTTWVPRRSST